MVATLVAIAMLIVASGLALVLARAQQRTEVKPTDRDAVSTAAIANGARPHETVTAIATVPIPNLPAKRLVSRVIDYPPGSASAPHRHAGSAFIYAYVLSDPEPGRYRTDSRLSGW
jgi:hypothetical protein